MAIFCGNAIVLVFHLRNYPEYEDSKSLGISRRSGGILSTICKLLGGVDFMATDDARSLLTTRFRNLAKQVVRSVGLGSLQGPARRSIASLYNSVRRQKLLP